MNKDQNKDQSNGAQNPARRMFIKTVGTAGAALLLPVKAFSRVNFLPLATAQLAGGSLPPGQIPKYRTALFIPPAMPRTSVLQDAHGHNIDYYEIAVRQFQQQMLPMGLPATTIWGFGSLMAPGTRAQGGSFGTPAFTLEARAGTPLRVKWVNDLKDPLTNRFRPHLLAVDQTLHWANPPGPRDDNTTNPNLYTGPVPLVPHVHGGHTGEESDGYPEAWFLPAASNIPAGYFNRGSFYDTFKATAAAKYGVNWAPGTATFQYTNDQKAATLWFHDHSLGLVRQNVYAGPVGFYLLRGGPGDQVGGRLPANIPGGGTFEIPIVLQDRSFNTDGSLFYPNSRQFFDGFAGPYIPDSDISPIWNAEFFGNTIVANGNTWPFQVVQRKRYRLRFLNACNARFLILKFDRALNFWQIGADGGFLPRPVQQTQLLIAPSERADVIVDFSSVPAGTNVTLLNIAPDEPYGGGLPGVDFDPSDPATTGQVIQFRVVAAVGADPSTPPNQLSLPQPPVIGAANRTRQVSFNELDSDVLPDVGPRIGLLGTVDLSDPASPAGVPMHWSDPATEQPRSGTTEIWEVYDFTEDAHPFHVHQVQFEIINREIFDPTSPNRGQVTGPEASERGRKDTVIVYPGTITRLRAHFDIPGRYVTHCHILEHEDNEMMRPMIVLP